MASIYVATLATKFPERIAELMSYQTIIAMTSQKYRWPSWIVYDPCDRVLLGMQWHGETYVDAALLLGLRSAPLIFFSVLEDALQWLMERMRVSLIANYIDDYITMGPTDSSECQENATIMHSACERVGLPVEPDMEEDSATT